MKYAYILQGEVMYIEDRDVDISKLVAPDLIDRFVEIPEGTTVKPGQIYSDGEFIDNPLQPADVLEQYQNMISERDTLYKTVIKPIIATNTLLTDAQALTIPVDFYPIWPDGVDENGVYRVGQIIADNHILYRVMQAVTPVENQPPHGEGMLAVYRPVEVAHAGTLEDPIPWVYGMDCHTGEYFSYEGKIYLCKGDMIPCTWAPGSEGVWQWEEVSA